MTAQDPRDHGYGPSPEVIGAPRVVHKIEPGAGVPVCPHCKCETLFMIQADVKVDHPILKSATGVSSYVGCPACPWASNAVIMATSPNRRPKEKL